MNKNIEADYEDKYDSNTTGKFIDNTSIEIIREIPNTGKYEHALFDFDGTLSLIREGWQSVMADLMLEVLSCTPKAEDIDNLKPFIDDLILKTTGKQTIYQMMDLENEIIKRGGKALSAADYKAEYIRRLMIKIDHRRENLRSGAISQEEMLVKGSIKLLEALKSKGIKLYLASGTDEKFVKEESHLVGVDKYFDGHIYGALDDHKKFSKAMVIEKILSENNIDGKALLGFGDGFVEIDNTKSAGGTAIGIAIDEKLANGTIDPIKRKRLLGVGADIIIPDYSHADILINYLIDGDTK